MKATLLVKSGVTDKGEYALEEGKTYLVGRSRDADIIVKDKLASRNHCKIAVAAAEEWTVADLGSSNGTYVNRQRITTRGLRHGDAIQIGKATLEFRLLTVTTAPTVITPPRADEADRHPADRGDGAGSPPPAPEGSPPAPPQQASAPQPPPPSAPPGAAPAHGTPCPPQQAPKPKENLDEDVRGLFEFLDKVGKGGRPAEDEDLPVIEVEEEPRLRLQDERTKTLRPDKGKESGRAPLFSLLDEVATSEPLAKTPQAPPRPQPPPQAPQAPGSEEGGLLAFLRKKKQQP